LADVNGGCLSQRSWKFALALSDAFHDFSMVVRAVVIKDGGHTVWPVVLEITLIRG
jgi:hypothetical protein